jgi:hypothetical protein
MEQKTISNEDKNTNSSPTVVIEDSPETNTNGTENANTETIQQDNSVEDFSEDNTDNTEENNNISSILNGNINNEIPNDNPLDLNKNSEIQETFDDKSFETNDNESNQVENTNKKNLEQTNEANTGANQNKVNNTEQECKYNLNNFSVNDVDISDLNKINDDFVPEIKAEKLKIEEEEEKRTGEKTKEREEQEEKKEEEDMILQPLKDDDKLEDIAELDSSNIDEFLKNNGKLFQQTNDSNNIANENNKDEICDKALADIKLDESLWHDLNLTNETKEKLIENIKIEIKKFCKNNLLPLLKKYE